MPASHSQLAGLEVRAELYLCLSKAFSAREAGLELEQMTDGLLPDLRELSADLPTLDEKWMGRFDNALQAMDSSEQLLVEFSRLFLVPPAPVPLNIGFYLDGGLMGVSTRAIESLYRRHELEKSSAFADLPDHLALVLQWLAWALAAAEETDSVDYQYRELLADIFTTIDRYLVPATGQMLSKASGLNDGQQRNSTWVLLLDLCTRQLLSDRHWLAAVLGLDSSDAIPEAVTAVPATMTNGSAPQASAIICNRCQEAFVPDEAIAGMITALQAHGVTSDHLQICTRCRETSPTAPTLTPPTLKKSKPKH